VVVPYLDVGVRRWFERGVRRVQHELQLPYTAWFESLRFAAAARQVLADSDLLYERMGWFGYAGAMVARQLRRPLVLEVNGDHISEFEMLGVAPRALQRHFSMRLMRWAARQATHAVATGEGWRQRHIARWGVTPDKVTVIENGSELIDLLRRQQLRAFQPASPVRQPLTAAYVGAFEPWHGLANLLHAAAKARSNGVDIRLLLIGDGKERPTLEALTDELGLRARVNFTGYLSAAQLAPLLAQAEIGVSPYCGRVEYSGLKLLDYKAAGLVSLASGADGQPAVLQHGKTGWIVPPCDIDALGEAIVWLWRNPAQRRAIGMAARLEAEQVHSWRHTAQELEKLFLSLRFSDA
jgi:glycosyltransferase involved in cell wall biosynthesis